MSEAIPTSFVVIAVILGTIVVGTVVGNFFVITAILIDKNLQTTANQLVLSLAVADLMVACLVMPLGAYNDLYQGWYLGKEVCEFWTSADVLCCTASILNLLAIALDRYWAVTSVDYIYRRTRRRVNMMILYAWTVAAVVSLAPMFGWKDPEFARRVLDEHKCMVSQDVAYQIFATISTFYAPLVLLLALYWRIFQVARIRIRRKPGQSGNNQQLKLPGQQQQQQQQQSELSTGPPLASLATIVCLSARLESQAAPSGPDNCDGRGESAGRSQSGRAADRVALERSEKRPSAASSLRTLVSARPSDGRRTTAEAISQDAPAAQRAAERQTAIELAGGQRERALSSAHPNLPASSNYGDAAEPKTTRAAFSSVQGEQRPDERAPRKPSAAARLLRLASRAWLGRSGSFRQVGRKRARISGRARSGERAQESAGPQAEQTSRPTRNRLAPFGASEAATRAPGAAARATSPSQPDGRLPLASEQPASVVRGRAHLGAGLWPAESRAPKMDDNKNNEPAPGAGGGRRWGRRVAPRSAEASLEPLGGRAAAGTSSKSRGGGGGAKAELLQFQSASGECCCCCDACRRECERCGRDSRASGPATCAGAPAAGEHEGAPKEGPQINHERARGQHWPAEQVPAVGAYLAPGRPPDKSTDKDAGRSGGRPAPKAGSQAGARRGPPAAHLSGRPASCEWSPSDSAGSITSISDSGSSALSASGCSSASSLAAPASSSFDGLDTQDRVVAGGGASLESAPCDFGRRAARAERRHQHHFCARVDKLEHAGLAGGPRQQEPALDAQLEPAAAQSAREQERDEQSDTSSLSASFPPPIELARAKASRRRRCAALGAPAGSDRSARVPSASLDRLPFAAAVYADERQQPPERSATGARAARSGHEPGGAIGADDAHDSHDDSQLPADGLEHGRPGARPARRPQAGRVGGRRAAPTGDLGARARKHNGISAAAPTTSPSPQPQRPDDKLSQPQRTHWLGARSNNVTGPLGATAGLAGNYLGGGGGANAITTTFTSRLAAPTAAADPAGASAVAIASTRAPQQKATATPATTSASAATTTQAKAAERQLHFQDIGERRQLNLGHQEGCAANCAGSIGARNPPTASGSQQAPCEPAGRSLASGSASGQTGSSKIMRSLDIRRKFRALGQLVSFVQTSRNFSNSGSSSAPDSQSSAEEHEGDEHADGRSQRSLRGQPGEKYRAGGRGAASAAPTAPMTTNGRLDFCQQQPTEAARERDTGAPADQLGGDEAAAEPAGGRSQQQGHLARARSAQRAERAGRDDENHRRQLQVFAADEQLDASAENGCLLSAARLAAQADADLSARLKASALLLPSCAAAPPSQPPPEERSAPALAKLPLNRQVGAARTPQVAPGAARSSAHEAAAPAAPAAAATGASQARRRRDMDIRREKKAAKTLAIITGVFVCCWLPFFLNAIIMAICGPACTPSDLILSVLLWLGYLNSLLNPIIYTIFSPDFRRAFRRLLCWPQLVSLGARFKAADGAQAGQPPAALVACAGGSGSLAKQAA